MPYKKGKYGSACYYENKLISRCTVADGEAYTQFMESCGGSAARVLQEYAYFSPELKTILEKVAAIQDKQQSKQSRAAPGSGLFAEPRESPWGRVQHSDTLCPGVFLVSTEGHGGIMVAKEMTAILSPAAIKCGDKYNGYLAFEEDCQEKVVLRELLDKKIWAIPERVKDAAAFEENINKNIRDYNPDYWRVRQSGIEKVAAKQPAPITHAVAR
jgi:hypothetical protein